MGKEIPIFFRYTESFIAFHNLLISIVSARNSRNFHSIFGVVPDTAMRAFLIFAFSFLISTYTVLELSLILITEINEAL